MANENLGAARKAKNDEFYTQFHDIEKEMNAYLEYNEDVFRGKTVLLPCDDPEWSNFTKFFAQNFDRLGLKKLISTSYAPNSKPRELKIQPSLFELESPNFDEEKSSSNGKIFKLEHDRTSDNVINVDDLEWNYLDGDGDFRSDEIKALRDESDIITNPPFSLFREFLVWIVEANKNFVILGNMNAITYREVFSLIQEDKTWLGQSIHSGDREFEVPRELTTWSGSLRTSDDGRKFIKVDGVRWFTNIQHGQRHQPLPLMTAAENVKFSKHKEIRGSGYKKYDNFDAIEVPFTDAIPSDHPGLMGVPISFLGKYNPDQFEIVGSYNAGEHGESLGATKIAITSNGKTLNWNGPVVDGVALYKRIVIRHRKASN